MGYNTDFETHLKIEPAVSQELIKYIGVFSLTRRMKRDISVFTEEMLKHCYNGNPGTDGEYYAFDDGDFDQKSDNSVVDFNASPSTQPGLWCNFLISDDGTEIIWNEEEKTYDAAEWIEYLIDNFLAPNGHVVNGHVKCFGESHDDRWVINVKDNKVTTGDMDYHVTEDMLSNTCVEIIEHIDAHCNKEVTLKELIKDKEVIKQIGQIILNKLHLDMEY